MNTEGKWNGPGGPRDEGVRREVEEQARGAAEKARSQVHSLAETGREELADQIGGLGRALHTASETLRNEEQGQAGYYSDMLAEQADRVSRYLREHDSSELIGQVEGFARRQPVLFLGGCVIAGLALGRFLKARPPEEQHMPRASAGEEPRGYETRGYETRGHEPRTYESPPREPIPGAYQTPVVTTETVSVGPSAEPAAPIATPVTGPDREER